MRHLILTLLTIVSLWALETQTLEQKHKAILEMYKQDHNATKALTAFESMGVANLSVVSQGGVGILHDYAGLLVQMHRDAEALPILERVIALAPERSMAYLQMGDIYQKRCLNNGSDDDARKAYRFYKQYVDLLRKKHPVPKIPLRVAETVYLNDKKYMSTLPDVWGLDLTEQMITKKYGFVPGGLEIQLLTNSDYLISPSGWPHFLFFAQVEVDHDIPKNYIARTYERRGYLKDISLTLNDDSILKTTHGPASARCSYDFQGTLQKINADRINNFYFITKIPTIWEKRKNDYCEGAPSDGIIETDIVDESSSIGYLIPLKDGTVLISMLTTVLRVDTDLNSRATFFNKTLFSIDETTYRRITGKIIRDGWDDQLIHNAISKYIQQKINEGK